MQFCHFCFKNLLCVLAASRPFHTLCPLVCQLEDETAREFSHLMWETQKLRVIKAGTLPRLVEALATVRGELDSSYMNVFLATYRTFATPMHLLQAIIDR